MKVGVITTTNLKGQIVIPARIRSMLGITHEVPLQLLVKGDALHIIPIKDLVTSIESDGGYLDLLKKTKGSWAPEKKIPGKRTQLELDASTRRKKAW